jgi:hypothetical protein
MLQIAILIVAICILIVLIRIAYLLDVLNDNICKSSVIISRQIDALDIKVKK